MPHDMMLIDLCAAKAAQGWSNSLLKGSLCLWPS